MRRVWGQSGRWMVALVIAAGCMAACDDEPDGEAPAPDVAVDAAPPDPDMAPVDMAPERDRYVEPDVMRPPPDMGPEVDMAPLPDVGPLDGAPCDPRLRGNTTCDDFCCEPGEFCVRVPGARVSDGRCQAGDGCTIGLPAPDNGCPDERPYCHLKGASTRCTLPGDLEAGDDCVDDYGIPQPCAEGLVCNNSVCQAPCDPAAEEAGCPEDGLCFDLTASLGVPGGLCGPRVCNWFDGSGCDPGRKCSLVIRNDGVLVGTCNQLDGQGNSDGALCEPQDGGGDNCQQGLYCTRPRGRPAICRTLCDTGQYVAPCPGIQACEERLQFTSGVARGVGICVTNQ